MKNIDFSKLPFDAGDKIWFLYKGQLYESEVQTVTIRAGAEADSVTYHVPLPGVQVFGSRSKKAIIDIDSKDVGLLAWKTREAAETAINQVTFTITNSTKNTK